MKLLTRIIAAAALLAFAIAAFAQGDPKAILKEINDLRTTRMTEARNAGRTVDAAFVATLNAEVKAKAETAIKDVDVTKIDAGDAFDWAQVYQLAGKHKEVCDLAAKFITSNPTPDQKFAAQMLMLNSCNELGEGEMIAMTIIQIKPTNPTASRQLASITVNAYVDTIAKTEGLDAALKTLDAIEKGLLFEDPKDYAKRMLEAQKQRGTAIPDEAKALADLEKAGVSANESLRFSVVRKKADLLAKSNRKEEAVKTLDTFITTLPAESRIIASAKSAKNQLTLPGLPAPALVVERQHGNFQGLESLKGKVVLLAFFAHW